MKHMYLLINMKLECRLRKKILPYINYDLVGCGGCTLGKKVSRCGVLS